MNDTFADWAVTTDPAVHAQILAAWDADDDRVLEDALHVHGLHPDSSKAQYDSVFLFIAPDGERIVMWEPGPGPRPEEAEADDRGTGGWGSTAFLRDDTEGM